jgi:hypothetical protein
MEDGVRVEVDQLYLVVVKDAMKEVTCRKAESSLEEGDRHHD